MTTVNERITRLVKLALSNKQSKASVFIGKIPHDVAAKVQECCKRNILGYSVFMDTDAIRHVRNEHPNVELRDFLLIPLILKEPIAIKASSQKNTVVFKKTLVLDYSCVELIVDDTKSLRLKTFYFNEPKVRK
ncbi:MAG: hypothetical protein K2F84_00810 [Bacteroidales bacterium]|nr:hypothetical protein [Bacteroidales bacterium]